MMSLPHLLLVLVIVLLVFGTSRVPKIMGDIGKGVRSLREGLRGDDAAKKDGEDVKKIEDKNKSE